jgi:IS1 family transposase/transposase-like protein
METSKTCFYCDSPKIVKNGQVYYGKQRYLCKNCGKQSVLKRVYNGLTNQTKSLIEKLLLERISLEGICRVLSIHPNQLYAYIDQVYAEVDEYLWAEINLNRCFLQCQCIAIEADEAWSFVGCKANKKWLWVALDRTTRQIVGLYVGQRNQQGALGLWESLPDEIRESAVFYTDDWKAYKRVLPTERHIITEKKGETNHIERFFCTLRQRASRMVRKSLSFSKKLERHIKALRFFAAHYNLSLHS